MERFPLADWIDAHPECRYDLATSGMRGSVPPPPRPRGRPGRELEEVLRQELADHLGVAARRVLLSHGASEANAWVLGHLAGELRRSGVPPVLRVRLPEYPPLIDGGRAHGFRVVGESAPAEVAVVSRPRNPEGDLWTAEAIEGFSEGCRALIVDETFREFTRAPSMALAGQRRLWVTGSFTKFYGADEARVGYVVTPPEVPERFVRYVGLGSDEVAPLSCGMAIGLLRRFPEWRRAVHAVLDPNLGAFRRAYPGRPDPAAPLFLDRLARGSGHRLAERCARASVLVAAGEFFGSRNAVRVCLTRRNFPAGLRAYLRIRGPPVKERSVTG